MTSYSKIGAAALLALLYVFIKYGIQGYVMSTDKKQSVLIGFAGDVMLGRLVNEKVSAVGDYLYPWGDMLEALRAPDLMIVNLETTLTRSVHTVFKAFNFRADPDHVKSLKAAGIDVVNLANNHILDFNREGLFETLKVLDQAGIMHVGAGPTEREARAPLKVDINGLAIGIVGCTDNEPGWQATAENPGVNYVEIPYLEELKNDIRQLRSEVDILILSIHWGPNKEDRPSSQFVEAAHALCDAGVDIIHGHSAHLTQAIEVYKGSVIMYSTGDFIDDYAIYEDARNDLAFLYTIMIEHGRIQKIKLTPTTIENMQVSRARGVDFEYAVSRFEILCEEFNTPLRKTKDGIEIEING